jgi:hypothetical protein
MGDKQDGLARAASLQAHHKILLVRQRPINMDIFSAETSGPEASGHSFCRSRHVAGRRVSCVDFNELFKNIACSLMFRRERGLRLGECGAAQQSHGASQSQKMFNHRALDYKFWPEGGARNPYNILIIKVWQEVGKASQLKRKWKMPKRAPRQV